ncbi:MAG: AbrB/MazE/SpoVT family DNA-binding domain-containing protein [Trueperaceae bacterium]|nr:AbrB/MazE/SpoVT family DNA-binding domain-containing protein [Trueperaceae bacterium]
MSTVEPLVQLSPRGQVTLPAGLRRALGLRAGDAFRVRVDDGRVVLEPVEVVPIELYDDDRIAEFEQAASMSDEELERARAAWNR